MFGFYSYINRDEHIPDIFAGTLEFSIMNVSLNVIIMNNRIILFESWLFTQDILVLSKNFSIFSLKITKITWFETQKKWFLQRRMIKRLTRFSSENSLSR